MDNKYFVAIGVMTIDNICAERNKHDLHFIVNKTPSGLFEATNLELILDASGKTIEDAIEGLVGLTIHYIIAVMEKGRGYIEIINKVKSPVMEDYWCEYRYIKFSATRNRKDRAYNMTDKINMAIENMFIKETTGRIKDTGAIKPIITSIKAQFVDKETEPKCTRDMADQRHGKKRITKPLERPHRTDRQQRSGWLGTRIVVALPDGVVKGVVLNNGRSNLIRFVDPSGNLVILRKDRTKFRTDRNGIVYCEAPKDYMVPEDGVENSEFSVKNRFRRIKIILPKKIK